MLVVLTAIIAIIGVVAMMINSKIGDGEAYEESIEKKELHQRFVDVMSVYAVNKAESMLLQAEIDNDEDKYLEADEALEYWKDRGD